MKVEIWGDITCTHCYTAKRKFDRALAQFKNSDQIEVVWKSFELAPGLQTNPSKFLPEFLTDLHGITRQEAQAMTDHVSEKVKEDGLTYDLNIAIPANSFNAHRVLHFAKSRHRQEQMEERLFKAYFSEGRNIDDAPTLVALAAEVGLREEEVKKMLQGDSYTNEVKADLDEARRKGITSVPKYIFNSGTQLSGGQESNVYLEALVAEFDRWQGGQVASPGSAEGSSCKAPGDCD
jgi:predicted DsbA family dithiol-disulfide isomerase